MPAKVRSPRHDDARPSRPLAGDASTAAPAGAHSAPSHSATNPMAPVRPEQRAAVEAQRIENRVRAAATVASEATAAERTPDERPKSAGGVVAGSGIAGIA